MFYNVEHECDVGDTINQRHSLGHMNGNDVIFYFHFVKLHLDYLNDLILASEVVNLSVPNNMGEKFQSCSQNKNLRMDEI